MTAVFATTADAVDAATDEPARHTTHHGWIAVDGRHVFVAVTVPAAGVRAGAVLVPPLGMEAVMSHRARKRLAERLARIGVATVRPDPSGVGDSTGTTLDPGPDVWDADLDACVDLLRGLGVRRVLPVGLRAGALFAVALADRCEHAVGAVLWDPVASGRRELRGQSAFLSLAAGVRDEPDSETVTLPGTVLTRAAARRLSARSLTAPGGGEPHLPVLALLRGSSPRLPAGLDPAATTVRTLRNAEAAVAPADYLAAVPEEAVDHAVAWAGALLEGTSAEPVPADAALPTPEIAHVEPETGRRLVERVVSVDSPRDGGEPLFAVVTEPAEGPSTGTTVFFDAAGNEVHHGPSRLWVTWSRTLAAEGSVCVRWDREGVGESGAVAEDECTEIYGQAHLDDIRAVTDALLRPGHRTVSVGLCSGGWSSARRAMSRPRSAVVVLSPLFWQLRPPLQDAARLRAMGWDLVTKDVPRRPTDGWRQRVYLTVRNRLPLPGWWLLAVRGRVQFPAPLMGALTRSGVASWFVFPVKDWEIFLTDRGAQALRIARRMGWSGELVRLPERGEDPASAGDHNLLTPLHHDDCLAVVRTAVGDRDGVTRRTVSALPLTYERGRRLRTSPHRP